MYGVIGLMASASPPLDGESAQRPIRRPVASSAASHGIGGVLTPMPQRVWSGFWLLSAVLFLFPANRAADSVSSSITGMASGEPSWYARALTDVGNGFGSAGATQTWVLALLSVLIALGPLLVRRYEPFLAVGGLLALLFWLTGQGLGGILTGSGTDPNTGPLIIILALAMVPTVVARPTDWSSPIGGMIRRHPALVGTGAAGAFCALLLAATYPAAAQPSGGSMSGYERHEQG